MQEADHLVDGQGVLYSEDSAAAALKAVQMGSAAESFSQVTGECTDVCAFAAGYSDHCTRQPQS